METNTIKIEYSEDACSYIGTAEELSKMVKDWIVEDIYRIPNENERSFLEDSEFLLELRLANKLDELARHDYENEPDLPLYDVEFTDYYNNFELFILGRKEKIAE